MKLISRFSNSVITQTTTLVSFVSVLAVIGPVITVSGGFWDAISHLLREPEFFWTIQHITVYSGVTLVAVAAFVGIILILKNSVKNSLKTGVVLVIIGAAIQLVSGYADSLSHDVYGIDGLISWSHQPLELGLVLASLGGLLILKNREHTKLKVLIPFSIISFIFFTTWLVFNLVLILEMTSQLSLLLQPKP